MQTVYYQTSSFIRHEGNLVDLTAYRRKRSAVSGGTGAAGAAPREKRGPALVLLEPAVPGRPPRRRPAGRRRLGRLALALDLCASLAVVVLTLSAAASFLLL